MNTASASKHPAKLCMIAGKGRSGSNRLLDIVDHSEFTACRSEANKISGGQLSMFGHQMFDHGMTDADVAALHKALIEAGSRRSERDRFNQSGKRFLTPIGKALLPLMAREKARRAMHSMGLMHNPSEWRLLQIALNKTPFLPVLKLNACPIWPEQIAKIEPGLRIVHNIRQPWNYLNGWYNRFIARQDAFYTSFTQNFADVPLILAYFGRSDSDRLSEPNLDNVVEVELWRWRYINERLMKADLQDGRYLRVTYEEIDADPLAATHRVFQFLDLAITPKVEAGVLRMENTLFASPHKKKLDRQVASRALETVLQNSDIEWAFENGIVAP